MGATQPAGQSVVFFPEGKAGGGDSGGGNGGGTAGGSGSVKLATDLHLVPRSGVIALLPHGLDMENISFYIYIYRKHTASRSQRPAVQWDIPVIFNPRSTRLVRFTEFLFAFRECLSSVYYLCSQIRV
jgi:hypothetical protein